MEMLPIRPFRHQIGIGYQYTWRRFMGPENSDRFAGLDKQRLVRRQRFERVDNAVERLPVARRFADSTIDNEILRTFRDFWIEIVHQHAHGRLARPVAATDLRTAWRANNSTVTHLVHGDLTCRIGPHNS